MKQPHLVILGGGISGLSLAWNLIKKHPKAKITLLEKTCRLGGWIETLHSDGFLFDLGPRSCRSRGNGAYTLRLIEELGLQDQVIWPDPSAKIRYIYENAKLTPLPHNPISFLTSPFLRLFLKALWKDLAIKPLKKEDESIYSFALRHFGEEVADRLIDPLSLGIFAGNCKTLSVSSCFPLWKDLEMSFGSLFKGVISRKKASGPTSPWIKKIQKEPLFSFKDGMETLIHSLSNKLKPIICTKSPVKELRPLKNGMEIFLHNQSSLFADHVYSTLPTQALNAILKTPVLEIPYASVACVNVGFNQAFLNRKGFGYLVPSQENESILGMVWDSSIFPEQNTGLNQTRLSIMIDAKEPKNYTEIALGTIHRHLGIKEHPDFIHVKVASQAIPQYPIGHKALILQVKEQLALTHPNLSLLGTAFHGVAINDCIAHSLQISQ